MKIEYLLVLLIGCIWTAIGITMAEARKKKCQISLFYLIGSLLAMGLLIIISQIFDSTPFFSLKTIAAAVLFFTGSLLNGAGQALSMFNLRFGGRALAYSIPQLAFVFPYFWSLIFWKQPCSFASILGLVLIGAAICYLGLKKSTSRSSLPLKRLAIGLGAMCLLGCSQICIITPTLFPVENRLSSWHGAVMIFGANVVLFAIWSFREIRLHPVHWKVDVKYGLLWGGCAVSSYSVLLPTLTILGRMNEAGIVFPVSCAISILLFSIFTSIRYKEKQTWSQKLAFASICAGILLVKLS